MALLIGGSINRSEGINITAEVTVAGKLIETRSLDDFTEFEINGTVGKLTADITPDGIAVIFADCPSQDCVHTGRINSPGEVIVCLPNQVLIRISDNNVSRTEVDAVAK
jgi:hypothetical protein